MPRFSARRRSRRTVVAGLAERQPSTIPSISASRCAGMSGSIRSAAPATMCTTRSLSRRSVSSFAAGPEPKKANATFSTNSPAMRATSASARAPMSQPIVKPSPST